jgi:hypothetical protein
MTQRHPGGRKSKGLRGHVVSRPPVDLADAVKAAAERHGLSVSDYVANLLAREHGFPEVAKAATTPGEQMKLTA